MYGAIFSSDKQSYECTINKSIQKLKDTVNIYTTKADVLYKTQKGVDCHYDLISEQIKKILKGDYSILDTIKNSNKPRAGCQWLF